MKSFAVIVAVGLAAVAHAQDQCAAVAAKVPTCAVCVAVLMSPVIPKAYNEIGVLYRLGRIWNRLWIDRLRMSMQTLQQVRHHST